METCLQSVLQIDLVRHGPAHHRPRPRDTGDHDGVNVPKHPSPPGPNPGRAFLIAQSAPCCPSTAALEEGLMPKGARLGPSLLSGLPGHLAKDLFAGAKPVRLATDEVLF